MQGFARAGRPIHAGAGLGFGGRRGRSLTDQLRLEGSTTMTTPIKTRRGLCLAVVCLALQPVVGHGMSTDEMRHSYDILRNGKPVGTHRLELARQGELTQVRVESRIDVKVLGIPVYRLRYQADETWDAQGLLQLDVTADKGGEALRLSGRRDGRLFTWTTNDGSRRDAALPLYPTNHWNAGVLEQEQVLNTLTGVVNQVEIARLGEERLMLPSASGASVVADRFRYSGGLRLESFYDRSGRWLGMRFAADDGSTIEYLCRDCTGEGGR